MWKASNAVSIDIRGAKGLNQSTINGVYEPTDEVCSGWPVYRKRGDANKWLEFFIASNKVIKCTSYTFNHYAVLFDTQPTDNAL